MSKNSLDATHYQPQRVFFRCRLYHQKLTSLQKEMSSLTDRSGALTQRAVILMEAKQKEALKREHRRQKDAEREENLVAKPAKSNK